MQNIASEARRPNSVRAIFEDGMATFLLSYDATFEDLADRLDHLAERHQGRPITVDVKLGVAAELSLPTEVLVYPAPRRNASVDRARSKFTIVPLFRREPRQLEVGEKQ